MYSTKLYKLYKYRLLYMFYIYIYIYIYILQQSKRLIRPLEKLQKTKLADWCVKISKKHFHPYKMHCVQKLVHEVLDRRMKFHELIEVHENDFENNIVFF